MDLRQEQLRISGPISEPELRLNSAEGSGENGGGTRLEPTAFLARRR